jgi:hypothetical protein
MAIRSSCSSAHNERLLASAGGVTTILGLAVTAPRSRSSERKRSCFCAMFIMSTPKSDEKVCSPRRTPVAPVVRTIATLRWCVPGLWRRPPGTTWLPSSVRGPCFRPPRPRVRSQE